MPAPTLNSVPFGDPQSLPPAVFRIRPYVPPGVRRLSLLMVIRSGKNHEKVTLIRNPASSPHWKLPFLIRKEELFLIVLYQTYLITGCFEETVDIVHEVGTVQIKDIIPEGRYGLWGEEWNYPAKWDIPRISNTLTVLPSSVTLLIYNRISSAVAAVVRLSTARSPQHPRTSEEKEYREL